ncbi:MAG: YfhO family protein [Candidatus Omnitrophota bacterium]
MDYYNLLSPFTLLRIYIPFYTPLSNIAVSNFMYIFYFLTAGFFMYIYARSINIKITGALTAGIIFAMIRLYEPNILNTYIWFPLILFFLNKALNKLINWKYAILTGIFYGMQLLGGGIQYSYYFFLLFTAYFILKSFFIMKDTKNFYTIRNLLFAFILIILISIGIFSIQFLPTMELAQNSARYYIKDYNLMYNSNYLNIEYLKAIIFLNTDKPDIFIGLTAVLLAFFPLFNKHKPKYYYFYLCITILFLVLSSRNFITNYLYLNLPFFSFFKKPIRASYIFIFSIALLSGFGIEKIKFKIIKLILLTLVLFSISLSWQKNYSEKYKDSYNNNNDLQIYLSVNKLLDKLEIKDRSRIFLNSEYTYFIKGKSYFSSGQSNLILLRYLEFTKTNLNISLIKEEAYYNFLLYPNYLKASGTKYVILNKPEEEDEENKKILPEIENYYENSPLFEKIYEDNIIACYQFKNSLQRVFFVNQAMFIKDKQQILDTLKDKAFDLKKTVILEKKITGLNPVDISLELKSDTYITKYQPGKVSISLKTNSKGFLVLSDTHYPGWKAYINDKRTEIYRANYFFRAVYIDKPGQYTVNFIYSPFSFKLGAGISLIILICSLGGIFWLKRRFLHQIKKK